MKGNGFEASSSDAGSCPFARPLRLTSATLAAHWRWVSAPPLSRVRQVTRYCQTRLSIGRGEARTRSQDQELTSRAGRLDTERGALMIINFLLEWSMCEILYMILSRDMGW